MPACSRRAPRVSLRPPLLGTKSTASRAPGAKALGGRPTGAATTSNPWWRNAAAQAGNVRGVGHYEHAADRAVDEEGRHRRSGLAGIARGGLEQQPGAAKPKLGRDRRRLGRLTGQRRAARNDQWYPKPFLELARGRHALDRALPGPPSPGPVVEGPRGRRDDGGEFPAVTGL